MQKPTMMRISIQNKKYMSIKANGRKIARSSSLLFTFFTWMRGWRCKVLAPSLFVGLSSADRDALGEDYMAKISWERAENPWRDKPLNCTENFSRNWSLKQLVFNGSIFCAMFRSATHRWFKMPQNIYSAIFWKLFKKPLTPLPFEHLVDF